MTVLKLACLAVTIAQSAAKVQVFVLSGQSNMAGYGLVEDVDCGGSTYGGDYTLAALVANGAPPSDTWPDGRDKTEYQHLGAPGGWATRDDVDIQLHGDRIEARGPLRVGLGTSGTRSDCGYRPPDASWFGPELQFGHVVGDGIEQQVLILKVQWEGTSLYEMWRPPSAGDKEHDGDLYSAPGPLYTKLVTFVNSTLDELGDDYELAGFVWFQGWSDAKESGSYPAVEEYADNLAHFMGDLRTAFDMPGLPFVIAGPGMDAYSGSNSDVCDAANSTTERPEFSDSTRYVETRDYAPGRLCGVSYPCPGGANYHWYWNAESYFRIGKALGEAALDLVGSGHPSPPPPLPSPPPPSPPPPSPPPPSPPPSPRPPPSPPPPSPPLPSEPPCDNECSDKPAPWMRARNKNCSDVYDLTKVCDSTWIQNNNYCQRSCADKATNYANCCCNNECSDEPAPWMDDEGKSCSDVYNLAKVCDSTFIQNNNYCQRSCADKAKNYANCC